MATEVVMPKLSPTMEEGQLARWLKKEGDKVSMGEPLAEIDTDKATMEMQALANGVLRKILIGEGESAPLGQAIAIIGEADEDIAALLKSIESKPAKASSATAESEPPRAPAPDATSADTKPSPSTDGKPAADDSRDGGRQLISPIAARMAAEAGINLKSVQGSGPGGRIVKRDVEEAVSGKVERITTAPRFRAVTSWPLAKGELYPPSAYPVEPARR